MIHSQAELKLGQLVTMQQHACGEEGEVTPERHSGMKGGTYILGRENKTKEYKKAQHEACC